MEIIPAIDLRAGRCVRLTQGDFDRETVFSDDPLAIARAWQEQGGQRLHVVDLDGAAQGQPAHVYVITEIVRELAIPVQVGGGIRALNTAALWLDAGVDRVVIGTAAVRDPDMLREICQRYDSQRVVVAVDAKDGKVAVKGWTEISSVDVLDLAQEMAALGVARLLYTDIGRDGMMLGPDIQTNKRLAEETGMAILASGGVSSISDIRSLLKTGVEGIVIGRALYTGAVDSVEAVAAASTKGSTDI